MKTNDMDAKKSFSTTKVKIFKQAGTTNLFSSIFQLMALQQAIGNSNLEGWNRVKHLLYHSSVSWDVMSVTDFFIEK